jgi:thioredoxin 2
MASPSIIVECVKCHARNRVPVARTDDKPVCGKCRFPLDLSNAIPPEPVTLTDFSFPREVLQFPGTVAVSFWTPRCGHCRAFEPIFTSAARHWGGRIKFAQLNIDQNPVGASRYRIEGTPTVVLFKDGKEMDRAIGAVPAEVLDEKLRRLT